MQGGVLLNLQKMKLDSEAYSNAIKETIRIIDEYISLYNEYNLLYSEKCDIWINFIREEFRKIYSELDFVLDSKNENYTIGNEESTTIYEIATFNTLEFKLMLSYNDGVYSGMRFLQTKPNTAKINIDIGLNIKKYTNNIELNRSRNGIVVNNYSSYRSVDKLDDIKNCINELNFNLDNIEETQRLIQSNLSELNLRLYELKNNDIIGKVEIDKEKILIESLSKLIELL